MLCLVTLQDFAYDPPRLKTVAFKKYVQKNSSRLLAPLPHNCGALNRVCDKLARSFQRLHIYLKEIKPCSHSEDLPAVIGEQVYRRDRKRIIQEAQLMLTTGSTRLAVSRGQQTWYHSTCYM